MMRVCVCVECGKALRDLVKWHCVSSSQGERECWKEEVRAKGHSIAAINLLLSSVTVQH